MHDALLLPEVVWAHCNSCGGQRNSLVRADYTKHGSDGHGAVDWSDTYQVLECRGCGEVIVRHEHRFSEDTHDEQDPETGELHEVMNVKATYFPPALVRPLPKWFKVLETRDELLAELLREVYAALASDLLVVATAGTRILLDRVMVLLIGEDAGGFADKLKAMANKGIIGAEDRELLGAMIDAGHAASHRVFGHRASTWRRSSTPLRTSSIASSCCTPPWLRLGLRRQPARNANDNGLADYIVDLGSAPNCANALRIGVSLPRGRYGAARVGLHPAE